LKVPLCKIEEIPEEGTKTVTFFEREVLAFKIEGKPKAILNICMHLGGSLKRQGDKLVCESHWSEFDCRNGKCLKGPANPESQLLILPTLVEDGILTYVANIDCQPCDNFTQLLPHLIRQNENIG